MDFDTAYLVISLVAAIITVAGLWAMFSKAGRPGWTALIPIYNLYVLIKLAGRPGWWIFLYLVPLVNIVIAIVVCLDVAKRYGKGGLFGFLGLFVFPLIGYPVLGFGDARYGAAEPAPVG